MLKMNIALGNTLIQYKVFVEEMGLKKWEPFRICQHPCYYHYPGAKAFNLQPMVHVIVDIYEGDGVF